MKLEKYFDGYIQQFYWFKKICALCKKSPVELSRNSPFCLARQIGATVDEKTKLRLLSELQTLKVKKYPIELIEDRRLYKYN